MAAGALLIIYDGHLLSSNQHLFGYHSLTRMSVEMQISMAFGESMVKRFRNGAMSPKDLQRVAEWFLWSILTK